MDFNEHQQLNQMIEPVADYPAYPAGSPLFRKNKNWLKWLSVMAAILAILGALVFLFVVYSEVAARDAKLKGLLKSAQQGTSGAIIESQLLGSLMNGRDEASSTIAASATTTTGDPLFGASAGSQDSNRRLAEKSGRPQLGNASSGLVIVEFADFNCSVCLEEFPIIRAISNKYAQDILFIFRNYPVIDQNSLMLAQAGLCAEEQEKFWPFHDRLFSSQGRISSLADFQKIAVMSGLDWNRLQDCINTEKYRPQVMEDMQDALDLGARGTPTFFVNGSKLDGPVSESVWEEIIAKYKELTKQQ
ncbi:MAG: thioredoxin domain-containing protein [Patescibacteria group bacterium]